MINYAILRILTAPSKYPVDHLKQERLRLEDVNFPKNSADIRLFLFYYHIFRYCHG